MFHPFRASHKLRTTSESLGILQNNATVTTNMTLLARHDNDLAFPYGPRWEAFSDQNALNRAKMGWYEAMSLIRAGIAAACARTPEFYRYFNEADFEIVNNMLVAMLGDMGSGPKEMADTVHTFSVVYGGGPVIGLTTDVCGITPNLKGFTNSARPDGRGAAMVLCPRIFDWYKAPLSWYNCDVFKEPTINEDALVVGSIIVHELTHWFLLSYQRANVVIVDYGFAGARYLNPEGVPKDGYGAYNSQQLRKQNKDPVRNADN